MDWLDRIAHGFIMTFGITQPNERNKRVASLFIGALLLVVALAFLGMIGLGLRWLVR